MSLAMRSFIYLPAILAVAFLVTAQQECATGSPANYSLREAGARNTLDWRIWLTQDNAPISSWHDVPIWPNESNHRIVNIVVEIPRWEDGKIEIKRDEPLSELQLLLPGSQAAGMRNRLIGVKPDPIFHDERNDQPRFVESVWPHKSYPFIYGSIPQTWESPNYNHSFTGEPGDNDPVDVFDIGQDTGFVGQVKQVKILGALALNDGGETDWKVLAIDIDDPLAPLVESYEDVEQYRPGLLKGYRDWFTYYKVARGDGLIEIVGDSYQNASFIQTILEESHDSWQELIRGEVDSKEINYNQTTVSDAGESFVEPASTTEEFGIPPESSIEPAAEKPQRFQSWYYLGWDFGLVELDESSSC